MTRLARLLYPLSLSAMLAGAVAIACSHRGEAPATPRPEPTSPSGMPSAMPMGGGAREGSNPDPIDAGVDGMLATPPSGGQPLSLLRGPGSPAIQLAAQPTSPSAPPPTGAPSPGAPPQPAPSPSPSPSQPSQPAPGTPPTGAPLQPGTPAQPGAPSQPAPKSPSPGSGSGSGSNAPGTSSGPADAGAFDAGLPQLPPIPDAGIPADSGMQPILKRD